MITLKELELLFDSGSFVELGEGQECSLIAGYGTVGGKLCYAFLQDSERAGGAFGKTAGTKEGLDVLLIQDILFFTPGGRLTLIPVEGDGIFRISQAASGADQQHIGLTVRMGSETVIPGAKAGQWALFFRVCDRIIAEELPEEISESGKHAVRIERS